MAPDRITPAAVNRAQGYQRGPAHKAPSVPAATIKDAAVRGTMGGRAGCTCLSGSLSINQPINTTAPSSTTRATITGGPRVNTRDMPSRCVGFTFPPPAYKLGMMRVGAGPASERNLTDRGPTGSTPQPKNEAPPPGGVGPARGL